MKTYCVKWTEQMICTRRIMAASKEEALQIAQDEEMAGISEPDYRAFDCYGDWEAVEVDESKEE